MEMIDEYLDELTLANYSPETMRAYESDLRRLFVRSNPATVTSDKLKSRLAKCGPAPRTRHRARVACRGFCRWMVANGRRADNPAEALPKIRIDKTLPTVLYRHEMEALIAAAKKEGKARDIALLRVLFGTGLRISECLSLTPDALANCTLIVRGKGNKERAVPVSAAVKRAVADWRVSEGADRLFALSRQSVARLLAHYATAAGLTNKQLHPHMCRHTFATNYLRANPGDIAGLAMLLGHASVATTEIYLHLTTDDLRERIDRM